MKATMHCPLCDQKFKHRRGWFYHDCPGIDDNGDDTWRSQRYPDEMSTDTLSSDGSSDSDRGYGGCDPEFDPTDVGPAPAQPETSPPPAGRG